MDLFFGESGDIRLVAPQTYSSNLVWCLPELEKCLGDPLPDYAIPILE